MASRSLNAKQARFAEEYACDLNGTLAAKRTGYSPHAAAEQASHLLTLPKVRARVAELQAATSARIELSHDDILRDLIALRSAAAEAGQFVAAIRATEMLGRHIGMWPTRVEVTRPEAAPNQQAVRDGIQTVIGDVISIITNHKLGLPLDSAAVGRLTADDAERVDLATAGPTEAQ
jgi:phage terminase small subunit